MVKKEFNFGDHALIINIPKGQLALTLGYLLEKYDMYLGTDMIDGIHTAGLDYEEFRELEIPENLEDLYYNALFVDSTHVLDLHLEPLGAPSVYLLNKLSYANMKELIGVCSHEGYTIVLHHVLYENNKLNKLQKLW